jgi:DNA modification methylase
MSERHWKPDAFQLEATTLWSFPDRGNWATHEPSYRGNWSPYIPRNLILRYTKPGELVLDPFVGGGTTAIEAKLLGRQSIALDINDEALRQTRSRTRFHGGATGELSVLRGDAAHLPLRDNSVDLVCAHPPYADIVAYSRDQAGDLSHKRPGAFLMALEAVAGECLRVTRPGGVCAVLMGDTREQGKVVPLGLETLQRFRSAGFTPKEIVIKAQHHTRMEGAWRPRAQARGFLLLAHEYLFILQKPKERS